MQETWVWSLDLEDPLEKGMATHSSILELPRWLSGKESTCQAEDTRDMGLIPGERNGNLLKYFCLRNPWAEGAWRATVHWAIKIWTQLHNYTATITQKLIQGCGEENKYCGTFFIHIWIKLMVNLYKHWNLRYNYIYMMNLCNVTGSQPHSHGTAFQIY